MREKDTERWEGKQARREKMDNTTGVTTEYLLDEAQHTMVGWLAGWLVPIHV